MQQHFEEILNLINSNLNKEELKEALSHYHASDIADVLETLEKDERIRIYKVLGLEDTAQVFTYFDDVKDYINELPVEKAADIIEQLDSDDAIDVLNDYKTEPKVYF